MRISHTCYIHISILHHYINLLFLYDQVLRLDLPNIEGIERSQRPKRLPTVFSRSEVQAILMRVRDETEGLVIRLLYGIGMRLTECLRLRVQDVDFDYGQIVIRDGKGKRVGYAIAL